jgi:hypothetical protein
MLRARLASIILAALTLLLVASGSTSALASIQQGDCNYDGNITAVDALMALKMSVGSLPQDLIADMNQDYEVTSFDAATILQIAVGLTVIQHPRAELLLPDEGLYINPVYLEVRPGDIVAVSLEMKPVDWGVSGAEIEIEFDPAALDATSLEPGDFLGDSPLIGLKQIDNDGGMLRLAFARVGETIAPSSPGQLASIRFEVPESAEVGAYELTPTKVCLIDQNFEEIAGIQIQGASIDIMP